MIYDKPGNTVKIKSSPTLRAEGLESELRVPPEPASPVHAACYTFMFERAHAHSPLPNSLSQCTVMQQLARIVICTYSLHRIAEQRRGPTCASVVEGVAQSRGAL